MLNRIQLVWTEDSWQQIRTENLTKSCLLKKMTAKICSLAVTAVNQWADILHKHGSVNRSCHFHVLLKDPMEKN